MILIVGGVCQGKQSFAENLIREKNVAAADKADVPGQTKTGSAGSSYETADGGSCSLEDAMRAALIVNLHMLTRRMLKEGDEISTLAGRLIRENPGAVITCAELGCGIVPADAFDRTWREETGRICTELAAYSGEVYRVICGIGQQLKGGTPG